MSEEREHITDGKPCWCGPRAQREGEAIIWVHRELPPCPDCAKLKRRAEDEGRRADVNFEDYEAGKVENTALRARVECMEKAYKDHRALFSHMADCPRCHEAVMRLCPEWEKLMWDGCGASDFAYDNFAALTPEKAKSEGEV